MRRLSPLLGIVFDGGQGHFSGATLSRDAAKVALGSTSFLGVRFVDVATLTRDAELRAMLTGGHRAAPTSSRRRAARSRSRSRPAASRRTQPAERRVTILPLGGSQFPL